METRETAGDFAAEGATSHEAFSRKRDSRRFATTPSTTLVCEKQLVKQE